MSGTLLKLIDGIHEVEDSDPFNSLCIYADSGPDSLPASRAMICPGDDEGSFLCPQDPELSYVLQVQQAKECIEVWSEWRSGLKPTPLDKFAAVMHYSRNDAWLPIA